MWTVVLANGPHDSEQHALLQPSPVQMLPAGIQEAPPTVWQRPSVAPAALVHLPPQHSKSVPHESPSCVQYDGLPSQMPFVQTFEQHSVPAPHGLPDVLQTALKGAHFPAVHFPPQHSPSAAQVWLSAVHCLAEQLPPTHA